MKISRRAAIGAGAGAVVVGAGAVGFEAATNDGPEPPAPPATDAEGHVVWRNWSGIRHSYPQLRAAPSSEDEIAHILKTAPAPIRVVGAGPLLHASRADFGNARVARRAGGSCES